MKKIRKFSLGQSSENAQTSAAHLSDCPICGSPGHPWIDHRYQVCQDCGVAWVVGYHCPEGFYCENLHYHKHHQELQGLPDYRSRCGPDTAVAHSRLLLIQHFVAPQGSRLLDIGGGNGAFTAVARSVGYNAEMLEPNPEMVEFATKRWKIRAKAGTLEGLSELPLWDLITLFHVFEHFPEPHQALRKLARILRPGGVLVIETPDLECPEARGENWKHLRPLEHPFLWSERSLRRLIDDKTSGLTTEHTWIPIPESVGIIARKSG